MNNEKIEAFVAVADGNQIFVELIDPSIENSLKKIGFTNSNDSRRLVIISTDNKEKAFIFDLLRNLKIPFSDGKEWCPSEVFEYLRDINLITGSFNRISWTEPGIYKITSV